MTIAPHICAPHICAIVPSYRHVERIQAVIAALRAQDLPVFVIDDGNAEPYRSQLAALHDPAQQIIVHRLPENGGKGAAMLAGFALAMAAGFSHAVQMDADGQHDAAALPALLEAARNEPAALITGRPQYDASIPRGRAIGRWVTHVWVWIETLSFDIRDSMCGFRVYPLAALQALLARGVHLGRRMDFDTEIMVRLFWAGTPVRDVPVKVIYPPGNLSNFDLLRDNLLISAMHTRLVLEMLLHLPARLFRRRASHQPPIPADAAKARHWARLPERGLLAGLRFCAMMLRLCGPRPTALLADIIAGYFYLTASHRRQAAKLYLARVFAAAGQARQPGWLDGYRLFRNFARRALDVFAAWSGRMPPVDHANAATLLQQASAAGRGAVLIVSHVGNVDVARAALPQAVRERMLILVHTRHAENYNRLLAEFNPQAAMNLLQVSEMNAATAIRLAEHVDAGGWVVIAGDRVPLSGQHVCKVGFLGKPAAFPQGPFILAALLHCPVYSLFCRQEAESYRLHAALVAEQVDLPRGQRETALAGYIAGYAAQLEQEVRAAPYQWYNFYDFWAEMDGMQA